jgi:hypothetical protein
MLCKMKLLRNLKTCTPEFNPEESHKEECGSKNGRSANYDNETKYMHF